SEHNTDKDSQLLKCERNSLCCVNYWGYNEHSKVMFWSIQIFFLYF
ncbi:hypothetical protein JMJ77_0003502, partial [Colletotrichum scovillei]